MPGLLTASQFVIDILAVLSLQGRKTYRLVGNDLDGRFANAFDEVFEIKEGIGIHLDFVLQAHPYHGDSTILREALIAAGEIGVLSFDALTFRTFRVELTPEQAEGRIDRSPLPRKILERLVTTHFSGMANDLS